MTARAAVVALTVNFSEAVTVNTTGGTPTLKLSNGATASYVSGSGTSALVFNYTVGALGSGQDAADLATAASNALALNGGTIKDGAGNAAVLTGASNVNPAGTLQIDTTAPAVASVTAPAADDGPGTVVALTVNFSEAVTVNTTGGTPTLTLSNGATASYVSGSGTSALVFNYTVGALGSGQDAADLTTAASNALALNGGTIKDGAGNAAVLTGASNVNPAGTLQIDTTAPAVASVTAPAADDGPGTVVALTVNFSEAVTVNTTGGTPTLKLSNGATASYVSGSGTSALVFNYTVGALGSGQDAADLTTAASNALALNGGTIKDGAGNAAVLTGASNVNPAGTLQIDTTAPAVASVTAPAADDGPGTVVALTVNFSEAVTVNTTGGTPTLKLSNGATASYVSGSGTSALVFNYTVGALGSGQDAADLTTAASNALALNGGTIKDGAGNAAVLTGASNVNPAGTLQIDTTAPAVASVTAPAADDGPGTVVALTVNFSEAVTVNTTGGTPTLKLSNGATASYVSGSGTSALVFNYTVGALGSGQDAADLTTAASNALALNGGTIKDGAGNAAVLTGASNVNPAGTLQIDTTAPAVASVTAPAADDGPGTVVALTVNFSEAVTVNTTGGTPTLKLSNGATASYVSGSGTSALVFNYTVGALGSGQDAADLTTAASNALALNGGTIKDGAGNAAVLTGASNVNPAGTLQIDTTAPAVASVTAPAADDGPGTVVALTVNFSEAVTVNTTGGTPTLKLSNGATASYVSGSGTSALVFNYTVGALGSGQDAADLTTAASNALALNGGTIKDGAGNAAVLTGASNVNPAGTLQIDTTAPAVASVTAPAADDGPGTVVALTVNFSEAVTVNTTGGTPTLKLSNGATASYVSGSGTSALVFNYTVGALGSGQDAADLTTAASNALALNGGTIKDGAGNAAVLTGASNVNPAGTLQIDTTAPVIGTIAEVTLERRPQRRQNRHLHHHHERSGDGQHDRGNPDAGAERRRHRNLHRQHRQRADLQLHGAGWSEHPRPNGVGGQPQRRHIAGRLPAIPPTCR